MAYIYTNTHLSESEFWPTSASGSLTLALTDAVVFVKLSLFNAQVTAGRGCSNTHTKHSHCSEHACNDKTVIMISRKSYESITGLNLIRWLIYLLTEPQVTISQNDPDHTDIFQQEEVHFKYLDDVLILPKKWSVACWKLRKMANYPSKMHTLDGRVHSA